MYIDKGETIMKKSKKRLFIYVVLLVLIVCVGALVYTNYNYNVYTSNINFFLSSNEFIDLEPICEFEGKNVVNIKVNQTFDELDFKDQEDFIHSSTVKLNDLYTQYQKKQIFKDEPNCKVYILSNTDIYSGEFLDENTFNIIKNENRYDNTEYLREKIALKISADDEYTKHIYSISDLTTLENIFEIDEVDICKKEILYAIAKNYLENNSDEHATTMLSKLGDYKDAKQLVLMLERKHEFDGTWYGSNGLFGEYRIAHRWIISGDRCYNVYTEKNTKNGVNEFYCKRDGNNLYIFKHEKDQTDYANALYTFNYSDGKFSYKYSYYTYAMPITLERTSNDTELPTTSYIQDPAIGMTAAEVKSSTWGSPEKINKDTYSWGVREQWVYGNGRYIYFQDGIVTSISTSD